MKEQILKLKEDIKALSQEQRELKNQRKTVHIIGKRTMQSHEARWKHELNRDNLRGMFVLYGQLRNRPVDYEQHVHVGQIEVLRDKYAPNFELNLRKVELPMPPIEEPEKVEAEENQKGFLKRFFK